MNRVLAPLCALALLAAGSTLLTAGCGKKEPDPAGPAAPPAGSAPRPEKAANGQPAAITVKHVLISFEGKAGGATRSKDEAQRLAYDLLGRAKQGEDFDSLMKDFSNDSPKGTYSMSNDGIAPQDGERPRNRMVPAFGNVGFAINVNEIGFADYDPQSSPYGFHIIKRIK